LESHVVSGLQIGETYWFAVEAYNGTYYGGVSNSPSATVRGPYSNVYNNVCIRPGDIADYAVSATGNVPANLSETRLLLYAASVVGTNVTFGSSLTYPNGTTVTKGEMTGNVSIGGSVFGTPIWEYLIAYNLTVGDRIYWGAPYMINDTTTTATCGVTRVVNHLGLSSSFTSSYLNYTELLNMYWDKNTGLMVKYEVQLITSPSLQSFSANVTLISTSVWSPSAPNPPVQLILVGTNATTPPSYFAQYGVGITTNGASNVTLISSSSSLVGTGAPPAGMSALIYLDITGVRLPGSSQIILYVYYNATRCAQLGIDENTLSICLWNTTGTTPRWQTLTSTHLSLNSTCGVIFASVPHFSYFAVFGVSMMKTTTISPLIIFIAVVMVIGVAAVALYVRKTRARSPITIKIQ
jgi:hypothetical protein